MNTNELNELFEKHADEYLRFERVSPKRSSRKDIHAFLLLDELFPRDRGIISGADHDMFYLDITPDELAEVASDELIIELTRCGVIYDDSIDTLRFNA